MSIDFDSAALQTQHEEEEPDPEDYAREQELHKLLTDLPDDMLEDSVDSSPELELEDTTCNKIDTGNRPQPTWTQQTEWLDHQRPASHEENYKDDYDQGSDQYASEDEAVQIRGHAGQSQPPPRTWNQPLQDHQHNRGGYNTYPDMGTERSCVTGDFNTNDFSTEGYEPEPLPHTASNPVVYEGEDRLRDEHPYGEQGNTRKHFQNFDPGSVDRGVDHFKVNYNPHQPKMFSSQAPHEGAHLDHLQREFLDSAQNTTNNQQLAQLQILNKAQQRQIEDLERKLEDSRRNMRYVEHQFAIVKDEKDGLAVSLKESSGLMEEVKGREAQAQNKTKSLEQEVQALSERNHDNLKKQRLVEAALDSMKQQMAELCRSDTLSRAREQHDRDATVMREQHEAKLLVLEQKLDSCSQALSEQTEAGQRLREQGKQLERQREEEQVDRAAVVNTLNQRLEESQQQCAKLLQTGSVQEMTQMQIKLQQTQSAKALSENMNSVLQEDLADLKEQITLYESALKHGVISLDLNGDCNNQLSESYMNLGIKKAKWKNGLLHSTALATRSDPKLPQEEALRELKAELQRCLASLKGKRQKISRLQEELLLSQAQRDEARPRSTGTSQAQHVDNGTSQAQHVDITAASQDLLKLQEDKRHLKEQVESLEKMNKELRQREEKLKFANSELCTKMREMIQELDQEKQETVERHERTQQQYRDDVVNRVRSELSQEHQARVDQLTAQCQQHIQQLQAELSEASDKMLAAQEFYVSVCKEKDLLEQRRDEEGAVIRENELTFKQQSGTALEKLRAELEAQHQASVNQLKALWSKEKETEIQQQVSSAQASWKEEQEKREQTWAQRLEEARRNTREESCQTDAEREVALRLTVEELDSRLAAQRQTLQLEADEAKRRAVKDARKQAQRELQEKHLEDMATQVEGALTRAYSNWLEDLTSLPEYKANLQREKQTWDELQEHYVQQQVSQALRVAEQQWRETNGGQPEEQGAGAERMEELQEEMASLQSQLEQTKREQVALLKAELAGARAAWNRDKQQEISSVQLHAQQEFHARLQEQRSDAREESDLRVKELLLKMEAELQRALRAREEEWRGHQEEKEQVQRLQAREEFLAELQSGLAEVQPLLLRDLQTECRNAEESRSTSGANVTRIIQASCRDMLTTALSQAKKDWKKTGEERLSRALKETQEHHEREICKITSSVSQKLEEVRCGKQCAETVGKLQKKNQDFQRHLEKACRHLQNTVQENKATMQRLKDEHEAGLQQLKEDHLLKLEDVKRSIGSSGSTDHQRSLQSGLEEMKHQYLMAVEKIKGDMLRYLQESKERAAEMIRVEVQRERQDTARRMRCYYLTCLQELLEDGGQTAGAEKKIMNAASKLVAMAKVLETPIKRKPGKDQGLPTLLKAAFATDNSPGRSAGFKKNLSTALQVSETRPEEWTLRDEIRTDLSALAAVRTKPLSKATRHDSDHLRKKSREVCLQEVCLQEVHSGQLRKKSREVCLQEVDSGHLNHHLLIQEPPVKDQGESDWSLVSNGSLPHSGRKVEPARAVSRCTASSDRSGEFGSLTPDDSDMTVYEEIHKILPHAKALSHPPGTKTSARGGPAGSEAGKRHVARSKTLFSTLKQCPQSVDSGFGSPFFEPK